MNEALLLGGRRSPILPAHGELSGWHPVELLAHTLRGTVEQLDVDPASIDAIFCGCSQPVGAQANAMANAASLLLGWSDDIVVTMVEGGAASGHLALLHAVAAVETGMARAAIGCAVEVMSLVPEGATALARNYGRVWGDQFAATHGEGMLPPPAAADQWAIDAGWTHQQLAASVARRHEIPARSGLLETQLKHRDGATITVEQRTRSSDFHATLSTAPLEPVHGSGGLLTADMVAQMADGAAAIVVGTTAPGSSGATAAARPIGPLERVGGSSHTDPALVVTAATRALERCRSAQVHVDEPTAATALAADLAGLEPGQPGALMTGRPGAVGPVAAMADFLTSDHETAVFASNLGLGPAIATTLQRV